MLTERQLHNLDRAIWVLMALIVACAAWLAFDLRADPRTPPPVTDPRNAAQKVYDPDPNCATEPPRWDWPRPEVTECYRTVAAEHIMRRVRSGEIMVGPRSPLVAACGGSNEPGWSACVEAWWGAHVSMLPEVRWGASPRWLLGNNGGTIEWVCAAGVTYREYLFVALVQDRVRVNRLVSWEAGNWTVTQIIDRPDLGDRQTPVGDATAYALASCPAK